LKNQEILHFYQFVVQFYDWKLFNNLDFFPDVEAATVNLFFLEDFVFMFQNLTGF